MKDYTLNKDEKRTFILSYRIEKDDIIVKFADNKELKYPYTIELEKSILEKMKEQVFKYIIDSNEKEKTLTKNFQKYMGSLIIYIAITIFGTLSAFVAPTIIQLIISAVMIVIGSVSATINFTKAIKVYSTIRDMVKNQIFIKNEELFQNNVNKDMGIYVDAKEGTKQLIADIHNYNKINSQVSYPNINDIDKVSYKTVMELDDLIKRNEEFSKYHNNIKKKTLTKN